MKNIVFILSLLCLSALSFAQTQEAKWGLGVYPSALSFDALNESGTLLEPENYEPGVRFVIARYLNASFDLGVDGTLAVIRTPVTASNNNENRLERDNFYDGDIFLKYKLNNGYLFGKNSLFAPYLRAGIGPNFSVDTMGIFAPLAAGLNIRLNKSAYLTAESAYKYGVSDSNNYLHHSVGITIHLGTTGRNMNLSKKPADADKDGVPDFADKCPDTKGDALANGCPDADGDGILDAVDKCPNTRGYANLGGCLDKDNDGVGDADDKCPNTFGDVSTDGCPTGDALVVSSEDSDGDNIPDVLDKCPNTKGSFTASGCPDADNDGIADGKDTCPNTYGKAAYSGCPYDAIGMERLSKGFDPSKAPVTKVVTKTDPAATATTSAPSGFGLSVTSVSRSEIEPVDFDYCAYFDEFRSEFEQAILFNSGSVVLNTSTRKVLDRLAKFTKKCGSRSVVIKAHTDNVGDETFNQQLSERRAEAVKNYLVKKGVDEMLLQSVGYGSMQPVAPNDTPENKAKNRRVELEIR